MEGFLDSVVACLLFTHRIELKILPEEVLLRIQIPADAGKEEASIHAETVSKA